MDLHRNEYQGMAGGVCAGLSESFNVDVSIIRIIWLFCILGLGFGLILYIIMWIVLPDRSLDDHEEETYHESRYRK